MKSRLHVPSPTLGVKRVCPSCGARFYDLNKKPISCPKCAFSFEPDVLLKPRRPRTPEKVRPVDAAPVAAKEEDETPDYEEESESEETLDDDSEESETETEVEEETALPETSDDEEDEEAKPAAAPKGRRGATEEVDPDLIEVDEDEALEGEEEEDDTLIEADEEGDSDLSDIEIEKDDEDR
jgi:uncharacterized protein (TIGR02300 family)